jgi:hypothetical protein
MSEPTKAAEYIRCPACKGECYWLAEDGIEEPCEECEGEGEVCDRCGAPPEYQVGDEWRGGCWCHY